jgi:hypothetical protein
MTISDQLQAAIGWEPFRAYQSAFAATVSAAGYRSGVHAT